VSVAAAAAWERWATWYEGCAAPLGEWFGRAVQARAGLAVLDVGCGAGFPALALASGVRPGGRVVATDVSPEMVAVVARRAKALALDPVVARVADAADLPFEDEAFDAVTCSTALMLCREPTRVAAEMRRVLKPGGRLAVAVWAERFRSPFFEMALTTLAAALPPSRPGAPGPFRLGPPGALEGVLHAAAFSDVEIESRPFPFECASPEEYVEAFTSLAAGLSDRLAALPAGEGGRLRAELAAQAKAQAAADGRVRLIATPLCATARR
jgi:SAM-dependent methyltransferase